MYTLKNLGLVVWVMLSLAGCSPKTAPVSSHTENTHTKDSVHIKNTVKTDSSFYKETLEEKVLPQATIGITTNDNQLDSLIIALRNLPSNVKKEIHYRDPKARAMLTVLIDSLGLIQFRCTAIEQRYHEKHIAQQRLINNLTSELDAVKQKDKVLKEELRQEKLPAWKRFISWLKGLGFGAFMVGFLIIVLMFGLPRIPFFRK